MVGVFDKTVFPVDWSTTVIFVSRAWSVLLNTTTSGGGPIIDSAIPEHPESRVITAAVLALRTERRDRSVLIQRDTCRGIIDDAAQFQLLELCPSFKYRA
jgi:hypothetical protein